AVKSRGMQVLRTEGEANGEWIIVDCGAAVAHIMQPSIRDYYHLEEIWGDKPVKMTLAAQTRGLVKAAEDEPAPKRAAPAKKAATAKKSAPAKQRSGAAPPARVPAKAPRKAVSRTVGVKKAPAKKATAKAASKPSGAVRRSR
ncbi:MAG: RsfS/YbeB/iojap family protein, partial [Burkholderiaceae bacterium]